MLRITMFSTADKVEGQGVGSAYKELVTLLKKNYSKEFELKINEYSSTDISHYHTVNPTFYLSTFQKSKRGIKIGYVHFLPETLKGSIRLFAPIQKIVDAYVISFYKRMDELIVVNPSFIDELEALGCEREQIKYIPNVVSKDVFFEKSSEEKKELKRSLGFSEDDFVVISVGQVQKRKGIDDFVELAKRNPDVKFCWIGGFSFGKITDGYESYKKIVENPPENLSFTGIIERTKLVDYYNSTDLFLLPSYNELFPMSILEAFNCGTPIMLRDLSLYDDVIEGYYLKAKDVDDMNTQIIKMKNDKSFLETYQNKSREAAVFYSEKNVAKIWHEYYLSLNQRK